MRRLFALAVSAAMLGGSFAQAQAQRSFTVHFDPNGTALSEENRAILGVAIEMAQECIKASVSLVGHDDAAHSSQRAQDLSMERADTVRKTMIDAGGINPDSFTMEGRGKSQLRVPTADGVGERQNRRVEINVACK